MLESIKQNLILPQKHSAFSIDVLNCLYLYLRWQKYNIFRRTQVNLFQEIKYFRDILSEFRIFAAQ